MNATNLESSAIVTGARGQRAILLDSNLLTVLFVGMWSPTFVGGRATGDDYQERDFSYLAELVLRATRWIVTPHVLTEADDRLDRLGESGASECRKRVAVALRQVTERRSKSVRLVLETGYSRLGLADVAVIRAARKHDCTVLTSDTDLYLTLLRSHRDAYFYPALQKALRF